MTRNYLDTLAETIRTNRDQPALTDFYLTEDGSAQDTSRGNHYTYGEMYAEICRVAELLTSLGLQKGDHVAICGTNSAHWVIAYLAIAKMQGVSVTVMHTLIPDEIAHLVDFSDAKALFTDEDIWTELLSSFQGKAGDRLISVVSLENWAVLKGKMQMISLPFREELEVGCPSFPQSEPDDLAMICFTSGTSGNAKGVMLSYRSISDSLSHTILKTDYLNKIKERDTSFLATMPMAHMFGLIDNILCHLVYGKKVNIAQDNISASRLLSMISLSHPYALAIIPSVFEQLITQIYVNKNIIAFSSLAYVLIAGSSVPIEIERKATSLKIPYYVGYGLSEMICIAINCSKYNKRGSSGKILKNKKIKITELGEILVKGENVMLGYYKDPEATAAKIDKDGWLHTGDKGHLDEDGYLYVEGRLEQDIIVLPNGENIRPDNIESLINTLPEVSESIVLAREGKLVAIVVAAYSQPLPKGKGDDIRRAILRTINPQLPLFSQLYDVEITDHPLARTEKQTIKRYLYS